MTVVADCCTNSFDWSRPHCVRLSASSGSEDQRDVSQPRGNGKTAPGGDAPEVEGSADHDPGTQQR